MRPMTSERVQRRIDGLLDQAEEAVVARDWSAVDEIARSVLAVDSENSDARAFLAMAAPHVGGGVPNSTETSPEALERLGEPGDSSPSPRPFPAGRGGSDLAVDGPSRTSGHGDFSTPTSFASGRYNVSDFLGEGGKKRVYLAHDTLLDREVAFALIKTDGLDATSRTRITREAQAMGRLGTHPNIVTVFDLGVEGSDPYMVTELMGGGDVEGLLEAAVGTHSPAVGRVGNVKDASTSSVVGAYGDTPTGGASPAPTRSNGLPLARTIEIAKAVCDGLEFAHARGVVHRDLKPGNVWLTEDGTAKIGDFGLAMMTDRSRLTREDMMVGTVSYMPPEQATGGEITSKADLYSLGAMLYEMVTGRPPFLGDTDVAIIGQHINTAPVAPTWHSGDCPRPLEALILRLLAKDPSERPDSAQDVFNALNTIDLTARGETVEREANSLESLAGGVFVGRQAEMDQLRAALEDVLGGRGRLVTLVGEPGIGKTRTSEELTTYAGLRGAQVLWGRCYEGGGAPPYWPWVQAIRSYVRDIDPDELRRQMGSSASVVAEIVTDVKDRLPEVQSPPPIDDPNSARFRLFDSITSFLKTASQSQPLVIVLDDLHWSDQPTLTFLEFIARELNQSRVMLLCTYRDMELNRRHPLSVTLGDLARDRLFERVLLRGLTQADIGRFVEIAAGFTPPAELPATVHRHTEGNPLFVTEVVRDLVQSGELTEETVSGRSSWSVRIPEGVREVIGRRLDRLSDRANDIFTTAAVIGRDFTLAALRELGEDTTEGQLLDVLDEALDAKLIEELPDEIGHYQFTHALVQETLTGELSSARKIRLHARIAETLEGIYGDSADDHAAELVPHFVESELILGSERSVHYCLLAGEQALASTAPSQALVHFEQALASAGEGDVDAQTARVYQGLGRARSYLVLDVPSAQIAFDTIKKAFDYYVEVGDPDRIASIALEWVVRRAVHGGFEILETAAAHVTPGTAAAGVIHAHLGWQALAADDRERASVELDHAFAIAKELDDPRVEVQAWMTRFRFHANEPLAADAEAALAALDRALSLVNGVNDPMLESLAGSWAALICSRVGRFDDAVRYAESAVAIATRIGFQSANGIASRAGADVATARGRWSEASEWVTRWEAGAIAGNPEGTALRNILLTAQTRRPDSIEKALEILHSADTTTPIVAADILGGLGELYYSIPDLGIPDDLSAAWHKSSEIYAANYHHTFFGHAAITSAGLVAVAPQDREMAKKPYELLAPVSSRLQLAVSTDRILGLLAVLLGDNDAAAKHFEDAMTFCRVVGAKKELAWACSGYAEMLLDSCDDDDRERVIVLQDEALTITRELGMRPLTERILARREILRA